MSWDEWSDGTRATRIEANTFRHTDPNIDGEFCSNDYLGLSKHPKLQTAIANAVIEFGIGPRGSALVCGYTEHHHQLEARLAELKQQERALLTPTGFAANLSVFETLAGDDLEIFSDALNHASIIDGCRLAKRRGTTITPYAHLDLDDLESKLRWSDTPRKLIATDSVFSMDGDIARLDELSTLAKSFGAWTMVDEAHATLVFGEHGGGVSEMQNAQIDIHVGTLSKAFGLMGGFVATTETVRDLLVNRGRSFIYSTALPIPIVVGALEGIEIAASENLRRQLWEHVHFFSEALGEPRNRSPIFSVEVGTSTAALELSRALRHDGFDIPAIRPPTVPDGRARVRVTITATQKNDDLTRLASAIRTFQSR